MYTDVQIINLGLAKIGAAKVATITPPRTSIERHCADGYAAWRDQEITKRRWVFSTEHDASLTLAATFDGRTRPYRYGVPGDALRVIREGNDDWRQAGEWIDSDDPLLEITYIRKAPERDFDPLFVDVLACRIALECVEFTTQSNTKGETAERRYNAAVREAGRMNAFVIGSEPVTDSDEGYDFITHRY